MVDQVELRSSQTPDVDLSSSRQRWESRIRDVLDRKWTGKRADAILAAMQSFKESLDHDIPSFHNMCATKLLQSMCRIDTTNLSSGFRQYLNDCFEKSHLNSPVGDLQDLISHGQYFEAMQKIHKYIPVRKNKKTSTRQQDLGLEGDLVRCWNASFHGNALQNLKKKFQYEHQMFVDKTNISPYAQTFDIIQSSGMGKSRVVEELAKEIFSIIFYLRKTAHESGFPAGDPEIYMFLMQPINLETTTTTKQKSMKDEEVSNNQIRAENLRAVSFFAGLFSTINTWLDKNVDIKGNELIELWHQYISPVSSDSDFQGKDNEDLGTAPFSNDHREGNYETTVNFGDEDESDTYESDVDNSANPTDSQGLWQRTRRREDFCRRVANKAETILSELAESLPRGWTTKELYGRLILQKYLIDPLQRILQRLPTSENGLPAFILGLDEAAAIFLADEKRYWAIHRVVSYLSGKKPLLPFWMVCMSTSSRIDKIVPQRHKDPSSRVVHQPRIDPFLALKLNIGEEVRRQQRPHEEILRPISELSAIEFLAGFGRPLWLLLQQKTNDANIQLFVMHKLLGGAPHFDPTDADHVFAALSYKICLDPALNECAMYNSNSLATVHVNSYLRLVIGIDREGGRLKTSTPPEPIVSDVASEILVSPVVGCASRDNWVFSIQTLTEKLVSTGRVEKGITGELYSRLLLILARDYLLATYLRPQAHFLRLSVPFEYSAFLEKLLGLNIVDNIKRELSYKYNSLAHKIEQGWMNFNHFSNTQTPLDGFNRDLDFNFRLISLLRSHSALQCTNLQRQVDMVIPIYFGDCSKKIDPTQVGALFIQSKNRMQPEVPWPKHKNNGQYTNTGRGYHSFYENLYEHTNPLGAPALVVLLLLDVGLSKSSETTFTVLQPEDKAKNGPCVLCIHVHHDYNNPSSTFPFLKDYDGLSDSCSKLIKEFFTDIHSRKQTFSDIGRMIGCTDLEALQLWEKQNTRPESVLGSHSGSRSEARLESLESKGQKRKLDGDDTNSG